MAEFITPYNGKNLRVQHDFLLPSLTDQSFKQECDIGYIIENCLRTGQVPQGPTSSYIDCTQVSDYQSAMQLVAQCKSDFASLPSKERDRFGTVEGYLEFISNRDNLKECYEKGYINRDSVSEDVLKTLYPERYTDVHATAGTSAELVSGSSDVPVGTTPQPSQTQAVQGLESS